MVATNTLAVTNVAPLITIAVGLERIAIQRAVVPAVDNSVSNPVR